MRTIIHIAGMRGEYCKRALFTALTPVAGIASAEVSLGSVTVEHDGTLSEADLRDAISVTGYIVTGVEHQRRALPLMRA